MSPEADPASQPTQSSAIAPLPIPPKTTEEQLITLWLHGKSPNTIRAYRRDLAAFRATIGKPIRLAYLGDLQRYADALAGSPASCARRLLVVKSLLSFAARMGYTPFNVGAAPEGVVCGRPWLLPSCGRPMRWSKSSHQRPQTPVNHRPTSSGFGRSIDEASCFRNGPYPEAPRL